LIFIFEAAKYYLFCYPQIIARYMQGKDMSTLFTDVVKNMATTSLELKKLIYLYIINNAREKADDAILVVNSFQRDAQNQRSVICLILFFLYLLFC
jgi:vesicle coat complex subunit